MEPVITLENVVKRYGPVSALEDFSLEVETNEVTAFVGENSAGKSTTIKLIMGFMKPTRGSVRVAGADPWKFTPDHKRKIGYVSEDQSLPTWMTVRSLIRFHSSFYPSWNKSRAREIAEDFELPLDRKISVLSKGQRRRVHLLLLLAQDPDILILDEPASGLDTTVRAAFLNWLNTLQIERPRTIFFSSHLLTDVEKIATRIAFIHRGTLVMHDSVDRIKERVRRIRVPAAAEKAIPYAVIDHESDGAFAHLWISDYDGAPIADAELLDTDLEAAYIALVAAEKRRR